MIYIQTLNKYWSPGKKLTESYPPSIQKSFEVYVANVFVDKVKKAINTQSYTLKWAPLSTEYLKYKVYNGLSPHTWESTSQLKETLTVYGSDVIIIGWDKRFKHKKTRYPLWKIAQNLEYGTITIPPRPLFRYVFTNMSKNIRRYWNKFKYLLNIDNKKYTIKSAVNKVKSLFKSLFKSKPIKSNWRW